MSGNIATATRTPAFPVYLPKKYHTKFDVDVPACEPYSFTHPPASIMLCCIQPAKNSCVDQYSERAMSCGLQILVAE
jgi:hypothetical protein